MTTVYSDLRGLAEGLHGVLRIHLSLATAPSPDALFGNTNSEPKRQTGDGNDEDGE